jgi:hypothetical protein
MRIGRHFFEISADTSKLNAFLREAIKTAEEAGVKITRAGQKDKKDKLAEGSPPSPGMAPCARSIQLRIRCNM